MMPALHHLSPCSKEVYAVIATPDGPVFYPVLSVAAYSMAVRVPGMSDAVETKVPAAVIALDDPREKNPAWAVAAANHCRWFIGFHNGMEPDLEEVERATSGPHASPQSRKWAEKERATYEKWVERSKAKMAETDAEDAKQAKSKIILPDSDIVLPGVTKSRL